MQYSLIEAYQQRLEAVEKVVVGAVGGPEAGPKTTKTGPNHL
jgi:hypothetical protein